MRIPSNRISSPSPLTLGLLCTLLFSCALLLWGVWAGLVRGGTYTYLATGFYPMGHTLATSQDVFCAIFREGSRLHQQGGLPSPRYICIDYLPGRDNTQILAIRLSTKTDCF